jgi:hypothetical protein
MGCLLKRCFCLFPVPGNICFRRAPNNHPNFGAKGLHVANNMIRYHYIEYAFIVRWLRQPLLTAHNGYNSSRFWKRARRRISGASHRLALDRHHTHAGSWECCKYRYISVADCVWRVDSSVRHGFSKIAFHRACSYSGQQ